MWVRAVRGATAGRWTRLWHQHNRRRIGSPVLPATGTSDPRYRHMVGQNKKETVAAAPNAGTSAGTQRRRRRPPRTYLTRTARGIPRTPQPVVLHPTPPRHVVLPTPCYSHHRPTFEAVREWRVRISLSLGTF